MVNSKWLIVYSSVTGNTKQIAEAMYNAFVEGEADIFSIKDVKDISVEELTKYDNIAVGYWLTRGGPDNKVQEFLAKLRNKTVVLFQTQGAMLGSEHSVTAFARAAVYLDSSCKVLGTFASQGKINPALLARRQNAGANDPHAANEQNKQRWVSAALHPNEEDFQRVRDFVSAMKHKLELIKKYTEKVKK